MESMGWEDFLGRDGEENDVIDIKTRQAKKMSHVRSVFCTTL